MLSTKSWRMTYPGSLPFLPALFYRSLVLTLGGLLVVIALVFLWRRLAGVVFIPLPPLGLLALGLFLALTSTAIHYAWFLGTVQERLPNLSDFAFSMLTTIAIGLLIAVLWLPGTRVSGIVAMALPPILVESWFWTKQLFSKQRPATGRPGGGEKFEKLLSPVSVQTTNSGPAMPLAAEGLSDNVLQQFVRRRTAEGEEEVSGWWRARFTTGERTTIVHLAFCPPFDFTPELVLEQVAGPETRLKTVRLLPHGARLELKLPAPTATACEAMFRFIARCKAPEKTA